MAEDISPLAQRLAEAHGVDLAELKKQLGGKITARSVLDYLNAADGDGSETRAPKNISKNGVPKNSASSKGSESQAPTAPDAVAPDPQPANSPELTSELAPADAEAAPQKEPKQEKTAQAAPAAPKQEGSAEAAALAKARAQLQVTAKVHQQALMQVGTLREKNALLEAELALLKEAEAQTRSQLEGVQKPDEPLEVEVEPAERKRAFAWLKKLFP